MKTVNNTKQYPFLQDGGEMGELTRNYRWGQTSLGTPDNWPQSLCTTLSILLNSRFPMFLFWGDEQICFYNDAYRPSLGNEGKHPYALGKRGADVWPEIWATIKPQIDQVQAGGEATWWEDQHLPIYRNGRLEDVYWTYSYSPVKDEEGKPAGVFVTCTETTGKLIGLKKLEESENQLRFAIEAAELATWDYDPITNKFTGNDRLKEWFGLVPQKEIDLSIAMAVIVNEDRERVKLTIEKALQSTSGGMYDTIYTIVNPVTGIERVVRAKGRAWFTNEGLAYRFNGTLQDVTEQRRTGAENQKLISMIEASHEFIGIALPDGVIQYGNPTALKMLGWQSVKAKKITDCIYPEDLPLAQTLLKKLIAEGRFSEEIRFVNRNNNQPFWIQWNAFTIRDAAGEITGLATVSTDITAEKKAALETRKNEAELQDFTERLQLALTAGRLGSYELLLDKGEIFCNPQCKQNFGVAENETLDYKTLISLIIPEDRSYMQEAIDNAVAGHEVYHAEYRIRLKDEKLRWVRASGIPVYNQYEEAVKIVGVTADITEERDFATALANQVWERTIEVERSKQAIQDSANRLVSVFNASQSGMFTFSPVYDADDIIDFRFVITNPTFAAYVNQTPEVLNGALGSTWFPGYLTNGVFDMYKHTYLTGDTNRKDLHYYVDGLDLYLDLMSTKVGNEVLVTFTDYTPLKIAQLQLEKLVEDLKRSNTNLEEFAYAASHDMKEPIRKIHFFADRLKTLLSDRFTAEETGYFTRMEEASKRMGSLIDDLLFYSEVSMQRSKLAEDVDLNNMVKAVLSDLELLIEQKEAKVTYKNLPVIKGHPRQLQQALQNLIGNALKFHKHGEAPVITITCTKTQASDLPGTVLVENSQAYYYVIEVTDKGIGFNQTDAERIFSMFTRLHGNAEFKGTGIGLSIVRKVAENHHGFARAKSEEGKGAVFQLGLPVK